MDCILLNLVMHRFYVHYCTFAIHWTVVCVSVLYLVLLNFVIFVNIISRTRLYITFRYCL